MDAIVSFVKTIIGFFEFLGTIPSKIAEFVTSIASWLAILPPFVTMLFTASLTISLILIIIRGWH